MIKAEQALKQYLDELKVIMFIQKLEEEGISSIEKNKTLSQLLKFMTRAFLNSGNSKNSLEDAIKLVTERDSRVLDKIRQQKWSTLQIEEPKLLLEEEAEITGIPLEELKDLKGKAKL